MRKYDKEFKEEAIKLLDEVGLKQAAAQLRVAYYTLSVAVFVVMCRVLKTSESGYYHHILHACEPRHWQLLLVKIQKIIAQHPDNSNYGVTVSKSTVRRTMKKGGLLKNPSRRPGSLTKADADAQKVENLIRRDFTADAPNRKWLTDITQIPCRDGKLYIAPVLDCYNGEIVGLAMDGNMKKELCIQAFQFACKSQSARGMILHSDRGSQFTSTSTAFRDALARHGAVQSMSGTGRCYDNARMESFFATFKKEKLYKIQTESMSMTQVKSIVFRYIMAYYNRMRIYTSNPGGLPPAMYRQAARGLAA